MALTMGSAGSSNLSLGTKKPTNLSMGTNSGANLTMGAQPNYVATPMDGTNGVIGTIGIDRGQGATTDTGAATGTGVGGGGAAPTYDPNAARRAQLLGQLTGKRQAVQDAYDALFNNLDTLLQSRTGELNTQYDQQFKKAGQDFADVLPTIDSSYAALGSYDSTQRGDNRSKAQKGYENTVATIGQNKQKDQAALGQYGNTSRAKFQADKEAALRYIDSAPGTTDVQALQDANNNLDTNLSQTGVTRAGLGTDAAASNEIKGLTSDNGRFQSALDSLDAVIKSSMPTSVKDAAVEAVASAGGLSAQDKAKIQAQYGNVYAEQNKL